MCLRNSRSSHSRVAAKWSTNASPNSARARRRAPSAAAPPPTTCAAGRARAGATGRRRCRRSARRGSILFSMPHSPLRERRRRARCRDWRRPPRSRYSTRCARRAAGNGAQRRRAVLDAPGGAGRRPEARDQPRIGVHGRGHHGEQLGHQLLLPADEVAHRRRSCRARPSASWKTGRPALVLERQVDVAALARPVVRPLRHEGRHQRRAAGRAPW